VGAVFAALKHDCKRALHVASHGEIEDTFGISSRSSITSAEAYWEMESSNALQHLERLEPQLRAFHSQCRERTHGLDNSIDSNARTIGLFLSKGEKVNVYAKTDKRVRFEVQMKPKWVRRNVIPCYTFSSSRKFGWLLDALAEQAAKRLNMLRDVVGTSASHPTPLQAARSASFVLRWGDVLGRSAASESVLQLLLELGRLGGGRALSSDERKIVRKAKDKRLLSRVGSNHHGVYIPLVDSPD